MPLGVFELVNARHFRHSGWLGPAIARADPVTGLELTHYTVFMAVLMRAMLDVAFGGDWEEDLVILTGLWLSVALRE